MYVCICIYIYMYTHIHVYIYICMCFVCTCDMTRSYLWHDSFVRVWCDPFNVRAKSCGTQPDELFMSNICILQVCNACVWHDFTNAFVWHDFRTESTGNSTPPKSTKSRNSNASVQIQINPRSQFEFLPRDTEESECFDLVDCGGVEISVETVIQCLWVTNQSAIQRKEKLEYRTRSSVWHDSFLCVTWLFSYM